VDLGLSKRRALVMGGSRGMGRAIAKTLALPETKDRLVALGFRPAQDTPEAFAAHLKAESEKWRTVVREANIKIE